MIDSYTILDGKPLKPLIEWIRDRWKYADDGYFKIKNWRKYVNVEFHTAGWSKNEDLYSEFERIKMIKMFWMKSERGGHYYYQFPRELYYKGFNMNEKG